MRTWWSPGGQRAADFGVEVLDAEQVVTVFELAALRVEAPAADVAALGDDHALGAGLRAPRSRRSPSGTCS